MLLEISIKIIRMDKITEEKWVGQSEERASTFKGQIERKKLEKELAAL